MVNLKSESILTLMLLVLLWILASFHRNVKKRNSNTIFSKGFLTAAFTISYSSNSDMASGTSSGFRSAIIFQSPNPKNAFNALLSLLLSNIHLRFLISYTDTFSGLNFSQQWLWFLLTSLNLCRAHHGGPLNTGIG